MCAPRLWLLLAILMRSCVADEVVFASTIPGIIAADIHIDYANQWMYFVAQGCIVRAPLNSSHCASTSSTFPTTSSDSAAVTVAGVTGVASFADGVDQNAMFNIPHAITGFHNGTTLFVVEWNGNRIRKLFHMSNGSYNVTTLAGSGTPGYLDATAGRNALFNGPIGIVIDSYNTKLYIADRGNNAIRQVDISTSSVTSLLVSTSQHKINTPTFLCLSKDDSTLYFSDSGNYRIARVSTKSNPAVSIDVISGTAGVKGIVDGQNNTAAFSEVRGIALTPDESMLFVGDFTVNAIRMVRIVDGAVITIAGNTTAGLTDVQQYLGFMTKPAPLFTKPQGLRLWLLDDGRWGVIITQDFLTVRCLCITSPLTFDPFPPSVLNESSSVQIRLIASGVYAVGLYINPYTHAMYATGRNAVMQIVNSKPVVIAGQISAAGSSDGVGSAARFNLCYGLTSDDDNTLYVTELGGRVVRMINLTSRFVTRIAGNGNQANVDGPGLSASFYYPSGLIYYPRTKVLYVGGLYSTYLRIVNLTSPVFEVSSVTLQGLSADYFTFTPDLNHMFITDYQQQQVLLFNLSTNAIVIVAGSRGQGGSSNGFGTSALFSNPEGLVLMGTNYEWPCLYINEDSGPLTNSLKEIRLRGQYVRRRPLRDELPSTQKHVALVLHEYRLLWYCTFDTSILLMTGVLVGIANSSAKPAVCGGCGIAIAAMYVVQFVVCVQSQPFTTMFSYAHQVLVLLLSTISAASQSANIILQSSDPSSMVEALASTMSVAAACDLIVAGLALLRSAMDIVSLVKAIQKSANGNQREETFQCTIKAARLPVDVPLASEIQPTLMAGDRDDEIVHAPDIDAVNDDMFWDVLGCAKLENTTFANGEQLLLRSSGDSGVVGASDHGMFVELLSALRQQELFVGRSVDDALYV